MRLIKVAAATLNQTPLDWARNKLNILESIMAARSEGVTILCLPEMAVCGYGCEDMFHSPGVQRTSLQVLQEIAPQTEGIIVSLGLPLMHRNALFDVACLLANGKILGFVGKRHLAAEGLHYEPRWFKPWPEKKTASYMINGQKIPLGDLIFDCGGIRVGFEICEDAWAARRPGSHLSEQGGDVIMNPSASHFAFGKHDIRKRYVLEGSRAFGVSYLYSNLIGNEAGRAIYDGGALIASEGRLIAEGPRFTFSNYQLTSAIVDVDNTRMLQSRLGSFLPDLDSTPAGCVECDFEFPEIKPEPPTRQAQSWQLSSRFKEEEFTRAVSLGLADYLQKSRARGFIVSLSGGADSTAVACLVATMIRIVLSELGLAGLQKRFGHILELADCRTAEQLTRQLLSCVYQSTVHSSEETRTAARTIAESIGARFFEFNIQPVVNSYVELVQKAADFKLTWDQDDLTLQNIQARVRAPGVWLLANKFNALLLSTSNRSEAAVGYATMDGDTCGGLSPIAGIDKAFLRTWLVWMQSDGPKEIGPVPALAAVNRLTPTAELRPPDADQTDEQDLMPYDLLDAVERAAIRDKHTPMEVYMLMRARFVQYDARLLGHWIARFFRLWSRNQWKRERYAPSFHLDDENLDPKTWCRFPILSGGYERELNELEAYIERRHGTASNQELDTTRLQDRKC